MSATIQSGKRANKIAQMYDASASIGEYAQRYVDHFATMVRGLDLDAVAKAAAVIGKCAEEDKTFFIAGNGGSGAVAGHWVNDLSANTVVKGKKGFRVMSLTDNAFSLTALANDASYEEIFSIQLAANMRPGDVVMALSVSGSSPNIVRAVEYANEHGGYTIGCSGFDGGKLAKISKLPIVIPSTKDEYGPVEDMFSVIMHIVQSYISMQRGRYLAH